MSVLCGKQNMAMSDMTRKARFQLIECSAEYCRRKARRERTMVVVKLSVYATSSATRQPSGPTTKAGPDEEGPDSDSGDMSGSQNGVAGRSISSSTQEGKGN